MKVKLSSLFLAGLFFSTQTIHSEVQTDPVMSQQLQLLDGETVTLNGLIGSQRAVLIEFWGSFCPPCLRSMEHLKGKIKDIENLGISIVFANTESKNTTSVTIAKFNLPASVSFVSDTNGSLFAKYGIHSIPQMIVLNKNGKILWTGHPMQLDLVSIKQILDSDQQIQAKVDIPNIEKPAVVKSKEGPDNSKNIQTK